MQEGEAESCTEQGQMTQLLNLRGRKTFQAQPLIVWEFGDEWSVKR
jgi:hypothetical protein